MEQLCELRIFFCERRIYLLRKGYFYVFAAHWVAEASHERLAIMKWKGFPDDLSPRGDITHAELAASVCTDCDPMQEMWKQAIGKIRQYYRFANGI